MGKNELVLSEKELEQFDYLSMIKDTSREAANRNVNVLADAYTAYKTSDALANQVEFWKWLDRNYSGAGGHMFSSNEAMNQYIAQGAGKENWVRLQIQGKGYEWDWMTQQRRSLGNLFRQYDAGDVATRASSDVTEKNLITGATKEYQMKAYTSKTNPNLKNTPKDMTVVTNAEKVDVVRANGYENVESFKDAETINADVERRMQDIKNGNATPTYNWKNGGMTMGKAAVIGFAFGITSETIMEYKAWKNGAITTNEYFVNIGKAGLNSGITAGFTSGIMIPVEAAVTAAGFSCPLTIPIAVVVGMTVDKFVAPCFGRGDYQKILGKVQYYQNLEKLNADLVDAILVSTGTFYNSVEAIRIQQAGFKAIDHRNQMMDYKLNDLSNIIK